MSNRPKNWGLGTFQQINQPVHSTNAKPKSRSLNPKTSNAEVIQNHLNNNAAKSAQTQVNPKFPNPKAQPKVVIKAKPNPFSLKRNFSDASVDLNISAQRQKAPSIKQNGPTSQQKLSSNSETQIVLEDAPILYIDKSCQEQQSDDYSTDASDSLTSDSEIVAKKRDRAIQKRTLEKIPLLWQGQESQTRSIIDLRKSYQVSQEKSYSDLMIRESKVGDFQLRIEADGSTTKINCYDSDLLKRYTDPFGKFLCVTISFTLKFPDNVSREIDLPVRLHADPGAHESIAQFVSKDSQLYLLLENLARDKSTIDLILLSDTGGLSAMDRLQCQLNSKYMDH